MGRESRVHEAAGFHRIERSPEDAVQIVAMLLERGGQ